MPRNRTIINTFTSGELDPILHERYDHALYSAGLSVLENFQIKPQGAVTRRAGTRFVALGKLSNVNPRRVRGVVRLLPFVFSSNQGVVLEIGNFYIRFFANNGQLVDDAGDPIELASPYADDELDAIQYAQSGDIVVLTHPLYPPYELARLGAIDWRLQEIDFAPPPTSQVGFSPQAGLTLSAVTGVDVTISADSAIFLSSDDDRLITQNSDIGKGKATITSVTSSSEVVATIITDFSSTSIIKNQWKLNGSPSAQLAMDKGNPVGAIVTLTLQRLITTNNANLVANGTFATLASWTDHSGPVITTGTGVAGGSDVLLLDTAATFMSDGVRIGHRAFETAVPTDEDTILNVLSDVLLATSENGAAWGAGIAYTIQATGFSVATSDGVNLDGGLQGVAWIEQALTVVDGVTYRITIDVRNQPISMMVGSTSKGSDLLAEFSYPVDNNVAATFKAVGTTAYLQFRNNQHQIGTIDNVTVRKLDIAGWRFSDDPLVTDGNKTDKGKYIKVNGGIIELTEIVSTTVAKGVIRFNLQSADNAIRGAWSLEEPMWSEDNGYPKAACFFGSHLFAAFTTEFPTRLWANRLLGLYDFSEGTTDDAAFQFQAAATEINGGEWLAGERVLLIGTQREEFTARGSTGQTLTPTSIEVVSPSKFGSAPIQPIRTQRAVLFIQRGRKRLREVTFADTSEDRKNSDLSIRAEHLTKTTSLGHIAYQQEPISMVWATTDDGNWLGMTYLLDQAVFGWARFPTQGSIMDVCVIPHPDGDRDQLWLAVDRGGTHPCIEYMDDAGGFYDNLMTDSTVTGHFEPPTTTVSGLEHLEGLEVVLLTDGYPQTPKTVIDGAVTLDYAAADVEVGLGFTSKLTILRPVYKGVALTGLQVSTSRTTLSVVDTINAIVNGQRVEFTTSNDAMSMAPPLFTGLREIQHLGWDSDGTVTVEQDLPYPITVRAVFRTIQVEEP